MNFSIQGIIDSLGQKAGVTYAVKLPSGTTYQSGAGDPVFTLVFRTDGALVSTFARGHMGLLEAYFDQDVDLEGSLNAVMAAGMRSGFDSKFDAVNAVENNLLEWRRSNRTAQQAKENACFHYGLGEPFYQLWLDNPLKMYTCAYWPEGTRTLEEAQRNKIDHVCRKIDLRPGERFVDIGCGFGGFMFRALETIGATGTGVNTCTEQVRWLDDEIRRRGLDRQLKGREADFRGVDGQCDTELFLRKHVFPGGWIPCLADALSEMGRFGLEVLDVENLRRHYALTLDEWTRRFDKNWPVIQAIDPARFDERFRRIWMCYLVGCAEMFRSDTGQTNLFQVLVSKGNVSRTSYPMTRAHLYGRHDA